MQRVVSRSELQSQSAASSDSGSQHDVTRNLKHFDELEFVQPELEQAVQQNASDGDDEVAFRLFAVSQPSKSKDELEQPQKIRLKSPSLEDSNQGFIQAKRDPSYYFQDALSQAEKENIKSSALTGQQVVELSKSFRPGSTYNWKVLHLPLSNLDKALQKAQSSVFRKLMDGSSGSQKRKRPGKKTRIKVRVLQQARRKRDLDGKAAAEAKEAVDKEKRTQRNREKKVKKKLREKAKKAATGDATEQHTND